MFNVKCWAHSNLYTYGIWPVQNEPDRLLLFKQKKAVSQTSIVHLPNPQATALSIYS